MELLAVFKAFSAKEKYLFSLFGALFLVGSVWGISNFVYAHTVIVPDVGGAITEGVAGYPRYINPVLADTSDADSAMEALIYSPLFKATTDGGIEPDVAENYELSENKKEYYVTLREGIRWHDGELLSVDDVLFTLNLIGNPAIRSPLANVWQEVKAEQVSDKTIKFTLKNPYEPFLQNLTFRIMPKHIWGQVPPENFQLTDLNVKPIGSGPYRFKSLQKDKFGNITQYLLVSNPQYYRRVPYIDSVKVKFFQTADDALLALKKGEITDLAGIAHDRVETIDRAATSLYRMILPRSYAVFFNTDAVLLRDSKVREALVKSVDRQNLVSTVLDGQAEVLTDPVPMSILGQTASGTPIQYQPEEAQSILDKDGWQQKDENGVRQKKLSKNDKKPTKLELTLVIPTTADHENTADFLKDEWQKIGISLAVQELDAASLGQAIRSRSYDMILFGTLFTEDPDLFPFWHSTQTRYPGLNLSRYGNKKVDALIEKARADFSRDTRAQKLSDAMALIAADYPALFLYRPNYIYAVASFIKLPVTPTILNTPEDRFNRINEWYINTKRIWKS